MPLLSGNKIFKKLSGVIAAVALMSLAAGMALASDPYAPAWRGTAGSTFQEWMFNTDSRTAIPENWQNPYGTPTAVIDTAPWIVWYDWMPIVYGYAQGWWDIAASSVILNIHNQPQPSVQMTKQVQVQIVYWNDLHKAPGILEAPVGYIPTTTFVAGGPFGGGWYHDLWNFNISSSSPSDSLTVKGRTNSGSLIDRIVVDTRYLAILSNLGEVRGLPEGTVVEIQGPVVTRSFGTFFYMENINRAAGIRINCAIGQTAAAEQTAPKVFGVLRTIDGELVIDEASVEPGGSGSVQPLGMNGRAMRMDLLPRALLARVWGRASVVSPTEFTLDDGIGTGLRVQLHGITVPMGLDGKMAVVTGVLGNDTTDVILRVNASDTITMH